MSEQAAQALLEGQSALQAVPGVPVTLTVNGQRVSRMVSVDQPLVSFIRDTLNLTGTKVGCETGQCGACLVLLDGVSVKSCAVLTVQANGAAVTTVEGLAQGSDMTPLQAAFWDNHAVQCGFCTPGMLVSMTDLLQHNPNPSEGEIRTWMDGNMCRCGCYQNIVRAVRSVAEKTQSAGGE